MTGATRRTRKPAAVHVALLFGMLSLIVAAPAAAQVKDLQLNARLVFYADDTEFSNPFRTGQTLLGTFGTLTLDITLSERLTVRAGGFGNWMAGSSEAIDQGRPVLAFEITDTARRNRIVLGTLDTTRHLTGDGPDRTGPHGLLPPMQQETLAFERAHETGIQWVRSAGRYTHDAWINWQRMNTQAHREIFDVGIATRTDFRSDVTFRADFHVAHQGGQKGGVEPVSDSMAAATGVEVGGPVGRFERLSLELYAVGSRHVPDRENPDATRSGLGTFVRVALVDQPWRAHLVLWRGDDYIKQEGDPVYLSRRRDGSWYRGVRDYLELGGSRRFALADNAFAEASVRFHRIENNYDWSIRVLGVANLNWVIKKHKP